MLNPCSFISRNELGEQPTISTAAALFHQLCYSNKNALLAGIIVGGWDKRHGGSVYNINLGGTVVKQPYAIGGMQINIYTKGYILTPECLLIVPLQDLDQPTFTHTVMLSTKKE